MDNNEKKMTRREWVMLAMLCISVFLALVSVGLFYTSNVSKQKEYVRLDENYTAEYSVKLKENDHFGSEMGSGKVYVSELVDDIRANLSYRLEYGSVDVTTRYTYQVYIVMDIYAKDHKQPVYSDKEVLKEISMPVDGKSVVMFNEIVLVDYDTHLAESEEIINRYGLSNATTTLHVVMEVKSSADYKEFAKKPYLNTSVKLNIPINDSTFEVETVENTYRDDKILLKSVDVSHLKTSSIIYALFAVVVFVIRNVYRKKTRDEKEIYESKLNDILTNYDSYIQRLHGDISLDSYEFVELTSIEDLLEIKETINLPIIMIEKENLVEFVILDKSNLSYIYKLSIEERE